MAVQQLPDTPAARAPARPAPPSPRLRAWRAAVLETFEDELVVACRVAVLLCAGHRDSEIKRYLALEHAEFARAKARIKQASVRLDHELPDEFL